MSAVDVRGVDKYPVFLTQFWEVADQHSTMHVAVRFKEILTNYGLNAQQCLAANRCSRNFSRRL